MKKTRGFQRKILFVIELFAIVKHNGFLNEKHS